MGRIDARRHSPRTQYEIRKQVIRLRKQGVQNAVVAAGLGISADCSSTIWQSYRKEGSKAIKPGRRGRRTGKQRTLCAAQESELRKALIDKTPDQRCWAQGFFDFG